MKKLFLILTMFTSLITVGQESQLIELSFLRDTVSWTNPKEFKTPNYEFVIVDSKSTGKPYKLGFKDNKIYVVNATGQTQPFVPFSYNLSCYNCGPLSERPCKGPNFNWCDLDKLFKQKPIGTKFYFENIIVADDKNNKQRGLVEMTIIQKIK